MLALFDCVARSVTLAQLRQIVLLGQLFQMYLDGIAVRARRILDFRDGDFAARLRELPYLTRERGWDARRACSSLTLEAR